MCGRRRGCGVRGTWWWSFSCRCLLMALLAWLLAEERFQGQLGGSAAGAVVGLLLLQAQAVLCRSWRLVCGALRTGWQPAQPPPITLFSPPCCCCSPGVAAVPA